MAGSVGDTTVEALSAGIGDALRSVIRFDPQGYEVLSVRDDVAAQYEDDEVEEIHRQQVFEVMHKQYRETLAQGAGRLEATVHLFECILVFRFLDGDGGVLVSVDRAGADVDDLVARCTDILESA